jgi:threonine synthase
MQSDALDPVCDRCGSAVVCQDTISEVDAGDFESRPPGVWRYRELLPALPFEDLVTLGEGGTPMLHAERLGKELGLRRLLIKDESRNPTGSFIDRGATVLVSLAKQRGTTECTCVTTGNLGASLAAYCAKAAIEARIRIHPSTDRGKLYQMLAYGAKIEATPRRTEPSPGGGALSVSAGNPYLLEGEKTTGFEIVQDLGWRVPDVIVVPVGTGGHLSMTWRAILQLRRMGLLDSSKCRLLGVRLVGPAEQGSARPGQESSTELEESEPFFLKEATGSMNDSGGRAVTSTTAGAVEATGLLAKTEGIFAEPASASVIDALAAASRRGIVQGDETIVCVITGAGLKDTKAISRLAKETRRVSVRGDASVARLQVGETKLKLLRSLAIRPSYGYELWKELSDTRKITTASIYQHLAELEELSLVRRTGNSASRGRERIPYQLTKKGADLLSIAGRLSG